MKNPLLILLPCLLLPFLPGPGFCDDPSPATRDMVGMWQGTLEVPGAKLRIVFRISKTPDGSLKSVLDSPDQSAKDIPVDEVLCKGDSLILQVKSVMGFYQGQLKQNGKTIEGYWKQGGMSFPLALARTDQEPETRKPQEPRKPFPYEEEEVVFINARAGVELAGTLTLPRDIGPFPAAVLVSGSGPQDRDEFIFGHRPFLVLSDFLTRNGIAVLRYDDRGIGKSTGNFSRATTEDFASDATAAVEFLKTRSDIKAGKIGLVGHSEGAIVAPMVANWSRDVAFVVLLAGPGMSGEKLLYLQGAEINRAEGAGKEKTAQNETLQKRLFKVVIAGKDTSEAKGQLRTILADAAKPMSEAEKKASGFSEATIEAQIRSLLSPWFRYFLVYDPQTNLSKLTCPVLAIWGEKDLQVPPKENLPLVEQALKKAGNAQYTLKVMPGLNHLFQAAKTGSPSEYPQIEETFSPDALNAVGDWLHRQVAR